MELTIDIRKPLFEDYLNYYFDRDDLGRFKVSHRQSVGKLLCSMVEYSYRPVEQKGRTRLLFSACSSLSTAQGRFMFISRENQAKFSDYLEAVFAVDFDRFYLTAQKYGIPQKDIILAFISSRRLVSMEQDTEMLKKRAYRQSLREIAERHKQLTNRIQYVTSKVEAEVKNLF